ncbi:hypothetical protein EXS65_00625 [Candidatus Peribacteria bacterium]|nr:hypothetical protein [Candidatus Peribacteria bacterium]
MPYIYVLFGTGFPTPRFSSTVKYGNPGSELQNVMSFDRYTFGLSRCDRQRTEAYVLNRYELMSFLDPKQFVIYAFGDYAVVMKIAPRFMENSPLVPHS